MPRNRPRGPSFCRITLTPCKTPRYFFTPSFFACNSPCNCNLGVYQRNSPDKATWVPISPNLDCFETVGDGDGSACCDTSGDECTVAEETRLAHDHSIQAQYLDRPYPVVVDMTTDLRAGYAGEKRVDQVPRGSESDRSGKSDGK
jgi:hypothetical protein